ncbi:MAG: pyrrolo-quinoline quinone [Betaproteobacteria bacterium HGW-Betaproteobacteria-4]|nr:MAG: pyrrolo-quinoline quinone [Betaproteobacteria bacterium HGW-Betaproteobacteria-4]
MTLGLAPFAHAVDGNGVGEDAEQFDTSWPSYNNDYASQRFSMLNEIDAKNVAGLKEICRLELSDGGSLQSGPIVVDGTLYVTTPLDTLAVDPTNCKTIWKVTRKPVAHMPFVVNRGAAYADGRIIRGTPDGHLLALDAKTGEVLWDNQFTDTSYGEFPSGAPVAWQGIVYAGVTGSEWGARGRVVALDVRTGRELWRFNTIPRGKEVGAETWKKPDSTRIGGGGVWSSFTVDLRDGELFVSVGNPNQDFVPDTRPGDNLFTNSLVVLDARMGSLKWWYQAVKHDAWDYDLASPAVLYQSKADFRDLVAVAGKDGYLHGVDRVTHKLLFKTATTTQYKEAAAPTEKGARHCPGIMGGTQWNGPAYDVVNHQLMVGAVDWCYVSSRTGPDFVRNAVRYGGKSIPAPGEKATGWITSMDADTGAVKWRYHTEAPVVSAITPTAGGITFAGDTGGNFLALDSKTGEVLMAKKLDGALGGGIVTYAAKGKQFVAAVTGNISRVTFGGAGNPSLVLFGL